MDANTFTIKQQCVMELASMSSIDIDDAKDELLKRGIKEPTWEQSVDMMTSMRLCFANIFMQELKRLAV